MLEEDQMNAAAAPRPHTFYGQPNPAKSGKSSTYVSTVLLTKAFWHLWRCKRQLGILGQAHQLDVSVKTISNAVIFLKTLFMAVHRHRGPHRFVPLLTWSAEHHDCTACSGQQVILLQLNKWAKAKLGCWSPSQAADFSCLQFTSHLSSTSAGLAWCWHPCWMAAGLRRTAALCHHSLCYLPLAKP